MATAARSMSFYQQCLGERARGESVSRRERCSLRRIRPRKVMHAQLVKGGKALLMASDTPHPGSLQVRQQHLAGDRLRVAG